MATIDPRSLGLSASPYNRAYSDLAAWDAGCTLVYADDLIGNDVIWKAEVYYDANAKIVYNAQSNLAGANADEERYKWVRPAAGHSFRELNDFSAVALNGDVAGAGFTFNSGTTGMRVALAERGVLFEELILAPSTTNATILMSITGRNATARRNILRAKGSTSAAAPIVTVGTGGEYGQALIQNIILLEGSSGDIAVDLNAGNSGGTHTIYVLANLIARPSDVASGGTAFRRNGLGRQVVTGNAVFGLANLVTGTAGSIYNGSGYNATDQADGGTTATRLPFNADPGAGTNLHGLAIANQFVNPVAGSSGDWRLKSGHGLNFGVRINAPLNPAVVGDGAAQFAGTNDVDMLGVTRPLLNPTIGALQDAAAAGGSRGAAALYLLNLMG